MREAFGGRKFDIVLDNGEIESGNIMKAIANWLHCMTGYGEKLTSMP